MKRYGAGSACVFKGIDPLEKLKCIWIQHEKLKEKMLIYRSCKQEQEDFVAWLISYKGRMHTLKFASVEERLHAWRMLGIMLYNLENPNDMSFIHECEDAAYCFEQYLDIRPGEADIRGILSRIKKN